MSSSDVIIVSTGVYVPPYSISNDELVETFNKYVDKYNLDNIDEIEKGNKQKLEYSSAEFIEKASGIKSRYVVEKTGILDINVMHPIIPERSNEELSLQAEMGVKAAKEALEKANLEPKDIDLIILSSSALQRIFPAVSIEIQNELGVEGSAYDMCVACSSATFGLTNAYSAIKSGVAKRVIVINVEICSAHSNFRERDSHFIFGDAASAIIVESSDVSKDKTKGFKILGCANKTIFSNNIRNNFGFLNICDPIFENRFKDDKLFVQNGRKVFREVSPAVGDIIVNHLEKLNIKPEDVTRFWLHQANLTMNNLIAKRVLGREASKEEAPIILDEYANTSSPGSIIAFDLYNEDLKKGDIGIISSFGAGYSIGSVIIEKL